MVGVGVVVVVVSIGELSCEGRDSTEGVSIERGASRRTGVDEVDDGFRWRYSASETFLAMATGVSGELLRRVDASISDSARIRGGDWPSIAGCTNDAISVLLFVMGEFVWDGDDV